MTNILYLVKQLVWRDISAKYKGTMLGIFWALLSPVIMLLIYTFVFGVVFQARWGQTVDSKGGFAVYLFSGLILHGLLAEVLSRAPSLMVGSVNYIKKVVFPLWLLPLVAVLSATFTFFISYLILLIANYLLLDTFTLHSVFIFFIIIPFLFFIYGLACLFSALGVFFKDISQFLPIVITVLMFMAPIFYPISAIPEAYQNYLYANPLTIPVILIRELVFDGVLALDSRYFIFLSYSLLTCGLGLFVFNRLSKGFSDEL